MQVLLLTHQHIGSALLEQAVTLFGPCPLPVSVFEVDPAADIDDQTRQLVALLDAPGDEVTWLVLTDLFGATPSNLAHQLTDARHAPIIHGLNLPMLVRLWNYHSESPGHLVDKLVSGARQAIFSGRQPS